MNKFRLEWLVGLAFMGVVLSTLSWVDSSEHPFGDDNSAHFAVIVHIAEVLRAGELNLWWHQSNMGIPLFVAYQPLPALTMGALAAILGEQHALWLFKGSIVWTWALMPAAWYFGARWFGAKRSYAVFLGLLTLCVHDLEGIGFCFRSSVERGLYTQHFGLLFLPLFVGSFKRMLEGTKFQVLGTAVWFALTTMSHLWVGLYAGIMSLAVFASKPSLLRASWKRVILFCLYCGILLAWWLVPLLVFNEYAGGLPWLREIHNGWPWLKSIRLFLEGVIFDTDRLSWLTLLTVVGALGILREQKQSNARFWIILTASTCTLFLGRTNLEALYNLLPMHDQVNVMRYITGIHICGILAAAYALDQIRFLTSDVKPNFGLFLGHGLGMVIVAFGVWDTSRSLKGFDSDQGAFKDLVSYLKEQPDHRIAVHGALNTGNHFHRDLLPLLAQRGQLQSYAHGFHCTLSTYYAEYFDFSPAACGLYDVGSIIAKDPIPESFPQQSYSSSKRLGDYIVFHPQEKSDLGIFSFISVQGSILGDGFRTLRPAIRALSVPCFANGVLPKIEKQSGRSVQIRGQDQVERKWEKSMAKQLLSSLIQKKENVSGTLSDYRRSRSGYSVRAIVPSNEERWLLLKVNMFPWWHAFVDGREVSIQHVAPNFMAIRLEAGKHQIDFRYENPVAQKMGALCSAAIVLFYLVWRMFLNLKSLGVNLKKRWR